MTKRNVIVISHNPANFEAGIARATELTAGLDRALLIAELYNANREITELKNELEVARLHAIPCECRGGTPAPTEPAADHRAAGTEEG